MKKSLNVLLFFAFITMFGITGSHAQSFYGEINNNTSCTIVSVVIYDNLGNAIYTSGFLPTGTTNITCTSGTPFSVSITYSGCTLGMNCGGGQTSVAAACGTCGNLDNYSFTCTPNSMCSTPGTHVLVSIDP